MKVIASGLLAPTGLVVERSGPDAVAEPARRVVEQVAQTLCSVDNTAGCLRRTLSNTLAAPENDIPFSYQGSFGFQRQFGGSTALEMDYVFNGSRNEPNQQHHEWDIVYVRVE